MVTEEVSSRALQLHSVEKRESYEIMYLQFLNCMQSCMNLTLHFQRILILTLEMRFGIRFC